MYDQTSIRAVFGEDGTPDFFADLATEYSQSGCTRAAFNCATLSIVSRAMFVMINGRWVPRASVMRKE